MKSYLVIALVVWFLCGFAGAKMLGFETAHWPTIVGGPFTLAKAFKQRPGN